MVWMAATVGVIDDTALTRWVQCDHQVWNPEAKTLDSEMTAYALTADQALELVGQIKWGLELAGKEVAR